MRYGHSKFCFNLFVFSYAIQGYKASIYFRTLYKNYYKMQMCNLIASIFGTNEEHLTLDSHAKFVVNLVNIQGIMSIYSHKKKDQTSVMATRLTKHRNNLCR